MNSNEALIGIIDGIHSNSVTKEAHGNNASMKNHLIDFSDSAHESVQPSASFSTMDYEEISQQNVWLGILFILILGSFIFSSANNWR